ncbi:MAG: GerW family sporulation protein [Firmicutes bacterium]|nr:GerW family sporulation protein [Bacillota bacterium]
MFSTTNEHPIERIMDNAFVKIRKIVDADTVIGNPVTSADGVTIIPISKVTMGFVTGGGEYSDMSRQDYDEFPFAGGSGAGVSMSPVGFLVNDGNSIRIVNMDEASPYDKLWELVPKMVTGILKNNE